MFLYNADNQFVHKRIEVPLDLFAAYAAVDVHDKRLVVAHRAKDLRKALFPRVVVFVVGNCLCGVLDTHPFHKVVDVLEVVVKGHAVYAAVLGKVIYGNFVKRLGAQYVFQRRFKCAFGNL